jgi:hypothetical protein
MTNGPCSLAGASQTFDEFVDKEGSMKASDPDPVKRWQAVVDFYIEFASMKHWEFLSPMVGLAEWVGKQSFAARLYPGTWHEWLIVSLVPGYEPDEPFFSCLSLGDNTFGCELWSAVGRSRDKRVFPLQQAHKAFTEFVGRLESIAESGVPPDCGGK